MRCYASASAPRPRSARLLARAVSKYVCDRALLDDLLEFTVNPRHCLFLAIAQLAVPSDAPNRVVEVEASDLVVVLLSRVRVEEVVDVETNQTCGRHHRLL